MLRENLTTISIVSVAATSIDTAIALLNARLGHASVEYLLLHPALTEQTKLLNQSCYTADGKNKYFAIFSLDEQQGLDCFHSINKSVASCVRHNTFPLTPCQLLSDKKISIESYLMDSKVLLTLRLTPGEKGAGWSFSFAHDISLNGMPPLQEALIVNCMLGIDGCSPLVDVAVRVETFELISSDAFAFRQRASIYRAVRRCFLKYYKK